LPSAILRASKARFVLIAGGDYRSLAVSRTAELDESWLLSAGQRRLGSVAEPAYLTWTGGTTWRQPNIR